MYYICIKLEVKIMAKFHENENKETESKSKSFSLKLRPSTFKELNRICAFKQLQTGIRTSVTDLINNILDEYVEKNAIKD